MMNDKLEPQKVLKAIENCSVEDQQIVLQYAYETIKQLMTDAVPVVHGHWEDETFIKANFLFRNSYHVTQLRCSKCKRYAAEITDYPGGMPEMFRYNFCPWCGAKMDESVGNSDKLKDGEQE